MIYVDELFFLNALTDYLLLLSCARLRGRALRRTRFAAAAALGGVYAVFAAIPPLSFLVSLAVKALVSLAHGVDRVRRAAGALRGWGCFLALSSAFAGAVYGISLLSGAEVRGMLSGASLKTLALSFGLCYAAVRLFFGRFLKRRERCVVEAKIELCGKTVSLRALRDTGQLAFRPALRLAHPGSRSRALSLRSLLPRSFCRCRTIRRRAFAFCPRIRCSRGGCGSSAFPPSAQSGGCSCAFVPTPSRSRASQSNISVALSPTPLGGGEYSRARLNIIRRSCPCFPICCNSFCSPCCRTSRYTISAEARFCPRPSPARRKLRRSRRSAPGQKRRTYAH